MSHAVSMRQCAVFKSLDRDFASADLVVLQQFLESPVLRALVLHPFCFNSPCQFTTLFNLYAVFLTLTPFDLFTSTYLSPFSLYKYNFLLTPLTFSTTQLKRKQSLGVFNL